MPVTHAGAMIERFKMWEIEEATNLLIEQRRHLIFQCKWKMGFVFFLFFVCFPWEGEGDPT